MVLMKNISTLLHVAYSSMGRVAFEPGEIKLAGISPVKGILVKVIGNIEDSKCNIRIKERVY